MTLPRTSFQGVRPFEALWPSNSHLPPIIRLRPDNRDPPLARPITEDVFKKRNNFRPHYRIARILHVHRHCHNAAVYAFRCTNLRQLTEEVFRRTFAPEGVSPMNSNPPKTSPATVTSDPQDIELEDQIRLRAYELYEARGREDGHELEDWLRAKEEIREKKVRTAAA